MIRCASRLHVVALQHPFRRTQLLAIPPHLPQASNSPRLLLPNFFPTSPSFANISTGSFIAHFHLSHSRCKAPAVDQVAAVISDMDFTMQAKPGLAKTFWESCRREAYASLYHPFVVSLAAGTLPKPAFQRYMAQDAYFLKAFKSGYQMAMESTEDEDAKATIDSLMKAVEEELTLHSSVMLSLDAIDQKSFEPNMETVAYCDFLQFTATGSNDLGLRSAKILASMTPCMRLYAFLGQEIKKHVKQGPDHPYQDWIDTYSASEFEAASSKVEQLLDKLTKDLTGDKEIVILYNLYRHAMTSEVNFFSAQSLGEPVHVPFFKCQAAKTPAEENNTRLLLVSDFDSTCTISDSCPVLADLTVQIAGKTHTGRSAGDSGATLLRKKWDELVMRYMDEYEEVLNRSLSNLDRGSGKAPSVEDLLEFLKEMSEFEQKANARVEEAEVLKGLSPAAIRDSGHAMPLREGCSDLFKRLSSQEFHVDTHILSVCWSKIFIEAVLEQGETLVSNVKANELVFDETASTGRMILNLETALDKQRDFLQILDQGQAGGAPPQRVLSVFVGDSLTDLLCLLRADVGIVLGDSSTLKQVYGEKMTPLFRKALALEQASMANVESGCVFTVSSWYEVEAFLLGPAKGTVWGA